MFIESVPQEAELSLPFNEFIAKTVNDCNMRPEHEQNRDPLAIVQPGCDHCYMFTHSTAWQHEPAFMEPDVVEQTARRIAEHAETHRLPHVRVTAHGGEPLMVLRKYPTYYTHFAETLHRHIDPTGAQTHLSIQTNGLLLNERQGPQIIEQLNEAGFEIGLSLDGPQVANDLHRRDRAGRSTHTRAERAAALLREHGANWGILGVIDPRTQPEEVLDYLGSLGAGSINLFPLHANHSAPPVEWPNTPSLGEWQKRALNRYLNWQIYHPGVDQAPFKMPIYDNYLRTALGARSINDTSGERTTQELFVTTGGSWERLDTLKSADDGAVRTGRTIFETSVDEMRGDPGIVARRLGLSALAPLCQGCSVRDLCFGGHYANRYKAPEQPLTPESSIGEYASAFRNPNAHCADLLVFASYVDKLIKRLPKPAPTPQESTAKTLVLQATTTKTRVVPRVPYSALYVGSRGERYIDIGDYAKPGQDTLNNRLLFSEQTWAEMSARRRFYATQPHTQRLSTGSSPYQSFPHRQPYDLQPHDILPLFSDIQESKIIGREALLAIESITQVMRGGNVVHHASYARPQSLSPQRPVPLSQDFNDAIVNSLLDPNQPYLQGVEVAAQKSNGYWFVNQATVDAISKVASTARGYVTPAQIPEKTMSTIDPRGHDYYRHWLTPFHITNPIEVTASDLPRDMLVVDDISGTKRDIGRLVRQTAAVFASTKRHINPHSFAIAYEKQRNLRITPLIASWPTIPLYDMYWTSAQPRLPLPYRLHMDDELFHSIDRQLWRQANIGSILRAQLPRHALSAITKKSKFYPLEQAS